MSHIKILVTVIRLLECLEVCGVGNSIENSKQWGQKRIAYTFG